MHEEGFRDYATRPVLAYRSLRKVTVHLVDRQVTLRLLQLVEDHNALPPSRIVLKKVEEPLEQIGIVLSQTTRRSGKCVDLDDAGKRATLEVPTNVEDRGNIVELCQRQRLQHPPVRPRAFVKSRTS